MREAPSNSDSVIDSRDIIARIEELRSDLRLDEIADAREAVDDAQTDLEGAEDDDARTLAQDALDAAKTELFEILGASAGDAHEDEREELRILEALAKEGEDYASDWSHGETLIRESYFTAYAEELAGDIGAIDPDAKWPLNCIDWEKAADELKSDYTELDFDGVTYFIR